MARAPTTTPHTPTERDRSTAIEGEVVEHTEKALQRAARAGIQADVSGGFAIPDSEVRHLIAVANEHPRSIQRAVNDIIDLAGLDKAGAAEMRYMLPKGRDKTTGKPNVIEGPSVRFAEIAKFAWRNNWAGGAIVDVDKGKKFVEALAIYWDVEHNVLSRSTVRRRIAYSNGGVYDDEMINTTGNAAVQIAMRNAVLRGIPKPIWNRGYGEIIKIIEGDTRSLAAQRVEMLTRFKDELGVDSRTLFQVLGVVGEEDIGREEVIVARGFFAAIRGNETTVEDLLRQVQAPDPGRRSLGQAFAPQRPQEPAGSSETGAGAPAAAEQRPAPPPAPEPSAAKHMVDDLDEGPDFAPKVEAPADEVQDGVAGPDEVYFLKGDDFGAPGAMRRTYINGTPEGYAGRNAYEAGRIFVYAEHSPTLTLPAETIASDELKPEGEKSPGESDTGPSNGETAGPAQPSTPALSPTSAELAEAVETFRSKVRNATSYLQIKAALTTLKKVPQFVELPDEMQREQRVFAFTYGRGLSERDPVRITNDPSFYLLWLDTEPSPAEVEAAFRDLIRSQLYRDLKDAQKGVVVEATNKAKGDDI